MPLAVRAALHEPRSMKKATSSTRSVRSFGHFRPKISGGSVTAKSMVGSHHQATRVDASSPIIPDASEAAYRELAVSLHENELS
jgi:hypothetical protein